MQHKGTRKGGGGLWKGLKSCIPGAVPGPVVKPPPWTTPLGSQDPGSYSSRDAPYYQAHPYTGFPHRTWHTRGPVPSFGGRRKKGG